MSEKNELRQKMREQANRLSAEARGADSRSICERIRGQKVWREAKSVLLFVPTVQEPDIWPLMKEGKRVSLPAFDAKAAQYEAREVAGEKEMIAGQFGIREPSAKCPLTDLNALDLVLAPGVAFALDGSRLGRGKGFYDRLLARVQAIKIGVCFDWQVLPRVPRDGHDVSMDYIVTAGGWFVV